MLVTAMKRKTNPKVWEIHERTNRALKEKRKTKTGYVRSTRHLKEEL